MKLFVCPQSKFLPKVITDFHLYGSSPYYGVDKDIYEQRDPTPVPYTDYLVSGAIIGELNCLTTQEMEYTVICETAVQTCFISMDDLFEAFLQYPSLEYKIWLKLALEITSKIFKENLACQLPLEILWKQMVAVIIHYAQILILLWQLKDNPLLSQSYEGLKCSSTISYHTRNPGRSL
ncbi:sodium/hydrogen exchanger 11-like [Chrysemys picta bellii]|uniref:sodium/hydrogen exchanger 11-like n=1 Tax=Chrysemys picta bellii TaxID=8478 RepID=UPI0032B25292